MAYPHTITNDSIVVIVKGKSINVQRGTPNFENLRQAIMSQNWAEVDKHLNITSSVEAWSKGNFKFENGSVTFKGEKLPSEFSERMMSMATQGESPEPLMRFWEKLQKNPSMRSVEQLFPFLRHQGIPIESNGNFLAYKGVNTNYTDRYSGRTDNKPGAINEMPRNKISDDPQQACHYGYHVGALEYARGFGSVVVVCEVDPADVVCIPYDCSQQKIRVCKYRVIGNHNGEYLPSTTYELEEIGNASVIETDETEEIEEVEEEITSDPEFTETVMGILDKSALTEEEKKLVRDGLKVQAVKAVRARLGIFLKEALELVETYRKSLPGQHPAIREDITRAKSEEEATDKAAKGPDMTPLAEAMTDLKKRVSQPKQKQLKKRRAMEKQVKLKVPAKYRKMHQMGLQGLMHESLESLRTYASKVLHIVGASKIPGGKLTLATQILKVRKNFA